MTKLTRRSALSLIGGAAIAMPFINRSDAATNVVNVYNWADYIGTNTLADFEKKTGIKVRYDTYSSQEEMQAKMLAGKTGYDVVDMAGIDLPRFIKAGIYLKLDKTKLPSWGNLDPEIMKILDAWDPGMEHGMPYMWGSVGYTYNIDMVKARIPDADMESLDLLFKPENAAKLADCGISILDTQTDVFHLALRYLGKDGNTQNVADYKEVLELFKPIRKYIRTFDNTNYLNAIANKELCAVNNWSGDYATAKSRAKEANVELNLGYFVPKTGAPLWGDCMCIPADAPHKENAHQFIEFLLQPEVIADCTATTNYANANLASKKLIDPEILANPAVYPDAATMARLWAPKPLSDKLTREMSRAFSKLKSK